MDSDCGSPPAETTVVRRSSDAKRSSSGHKTNALRGDKKEHQPLSKFWTDYFPNLSKNETFRDLMDFILTWRLAIRDMIVFQILFWMHSILVILLMPFKFSLYLYMYLVVRPIIGVIAVILKLLKLYTPFANMLKKLLEQLDLVLTHMFVAIGKLLQYIQEKRTKILEDLEKLWNKIVANLEIMVKSFVHGLKVLTGYIKDVYQLLFPVTVREAVDRIIARLTCVLTTMYRAIKKMIASLNEIIEVIHKAWNEDDPPPKVETVIKIPSSRKESASKRSSTTELPSGGDVPKERTD